MPYMNLDLDYFDHPQTIRLIGLLGRGAEVLPIRLWAYCGKFHAETGRLTGLTTREIERVIGWWGSPGKALEGLVQAEYLEKAGEEYKAAHWKRHQGHIWALKQRNKKAALSRWKNMASNKRFVPSWTSAGQFPVDNTKVPAAYQKVPVAYQDGIPGMPLTIPSIPSIPTIPNQQIKTGARSALKPPSLDEVAAYCIERGKGIDPKAWIDHYQANGWKVGRNAMKDWRAAVRTWEQGGGNGIIRGSSHNRIVGDAAPKPGKYAEIDGD